MNRFSGDVVKFRYFLFMILLIMISYVLMYFNIFLIINFKKNIYDMNLV